VTIIIILLGFELAVLIPLGLALLPKTTTTRHISIDARRFAYTPGRVTVNKDDIIILRFSTSDVTHGFHLDGYPIELIARKGVTFRKNTWQAEKGHLKRDWDRVATVKFTASRTGKFVFRCTETCGNLHPFMTGELIVKPNTPYHFFISLSIWVIFAVGVWFRFKNVADAGGLKRINLLETFPWLKRLVMRRSFQFWFLVLNFIVFYIFILSSLWGSPVGSVVVRSEGHYSAIGGKIVVPDVPAAGAGRMDLPQKSDGGQIFQKAFSQIASSLSRPPKRLAPKTA